MPHLDNGLPAASYVPLADVDPPLAQHVLEVLKDAGVAAYAEPLAGEKGPYQEVRPPDRPTTRVYVDRSARVRAREVVGSTLPGLRAEFLADAAARADRRDVAQAEVDAAWAEIVAAYDAPATDLGPVPPWPVQEDVEPDDPAAGRGSGLSGRLVRRAGPTAPAGSGRTGPVDDAPAPDAPEAADPLAGRPSEPPAPDDPTDHYVPPHPPPLPRPSDTVSRFAWVGVIGGPLLMILANLVGLDPLISGIGVAAFVAGFVTLVARMKDRRPQDDGWDDGAVV